jgi:Zn-finger nucleic acid-binding protein
MPSKPETHNPMSALAGEGRRGALECPAGCGLPCDPMQAATLNCPMCGASAATDATRCDHCGARLATVSCPSCFGLMFVGERFCSHCGARAAARSESGPAAERACPRCRVSLNAVALNGTNLHECPKCDGIWVDTAAFEQICTDRDKQATILGAVGSASTPESLRVEANIRYVPCPVCHALMNRVNFARCSHVIVDVCRQHGTWFDRDELRRIVEFIRAGGLDEARAREVAELEEQKRRLKADQLDQDPSIAAYGPRTGASEWSGALSAVESLLDFMRKR